MILFGKLLNSVYILFPNVICEYLIIAINYLLFYTINETNKQKKKE